MGKALLGDVEVRHHLEAGDNRVLQELDSLGGGHVAQESVYAEPQPQPAGEGFDVDVCRP